jgi:uncharacterized protein
VTLDVLPASYAICRFSADAALPSWADGGAFSSVTRTAAELSIVCPADNVPDHVAAERGYRLLAVRGPLDFGLVGVVAALSAVLASAAISIFVVSTYDTDYLLVRGADLDRAAAALRAAGHAVVSGA